MPIEGGNFHHQKNVWGTVELLEISINSSVPISLTSSSRNGRIDQKHLFLYKAGLVIRGE